MQRYLERFIVSLLVLIVAGLSLHTPAMVYLESIVPDVSVVVKAWKELLIGGVAVLLLVYLWRRSLLRQVFSDKIVILVAMIAVLHVLLVFLFDNEYVSEVSGLVIDLRNYLLFVVLYVGARYIAGLRRPVLLAVGAGMAVVIGFGLLQATVLPRDVLANIGYSAETIRPYLTVDLNYDYVRINSTLRGPNPVGAFVVIAISLAVAWAARHRELLRNARVQAGIVALMCSSLIVMWASHSRSAWLGMAAALMALMAAVLPRRIAIISVASVMACMTVLVGGLFAFRDTPVVSNVFFHDNQEEGSVHKSDDGHLESLQHGIEAAAGSPAGSGIGSAGSASLFADEPVIIENQFLFMAHESGWLGLLLQLALLGVVLFGLWRARADWLCLGVGAAGVGMIVIGMLLPVWADDVVGLYWWGIAGLALGSSATLTSICQPHKKTLAPQKNSTNS